MGRSQFDESRARAVEPGWPHGGRPKPERAWSLWKPGALMESEINAHPLGYEVRVYVRGEFRFVHATTVHKALRCEPLQRVTRERRHSAAG